MEDFDHIDEWAARFTRWQEFAKANNLTRDRRLDYLAICYRCKGIGKVYRNQDHSSIIDCPKCKGRGTLTPKPRYANEEIREVVEKLGPAAVQKLVKNYRRKK